MDHGARAIADAFQQLPATQAEGFEDLPLPGQQIAQLQAHGLAKHLADGDGLPGVVPQHGIEKGHAALVLRQRAEHVHAVLNLRVAHAAQAFVRLAQCLFHRVAGRILHVVLEARLLDRLDDEVFQRVGTPLVADFGLLVFAQQAVDCLQLFVQAALLHRGLHVIHQNGQAAALGNGAFGRVVGVVDVQMRQGVDGQIGHAAFTQTNALARQKFHIAVRAHMHHHIGVEDVFQIAVGGHVLVRRRHIGVVQDLADLPVATRPCAAAFGLYAHHGIAVFHTSYQNGAFVHHGWRNVVGDFARRLAPGLNHALLHFFGKALPPLLVVGNGNPPQHAALGDDFVHRRPAKFGNGLARHDGVDQLFAIAWWGDAIACRLHAVHDVGQALQGVEMRAATNRCLERGAGVVVQNEGHLALGHRGLAQAYPLAHALRQPLAALGDGFAMLEMFVRIGRLQTACSGNHQRLDHALELGHGH